MARQLLSCRAPCAPGWNCGGPQPRSGPLYLGPRSPAPAGRNAQGAGATTLRRRQTRRGRVWRAAAQAGGDRPPTTLQGRPQPRSTNRGKMRPHGKAANARACKALWACPCIGCFFVLWRNLCPAGPAGRLGTAAPPLCSFRRRIALCGGRAAQRDARPAACGVCMAACLPIFKSWPPVAQGGRGFRGPGLWPGGRTRLKSVRQRQSGLTGLLGLDKAQVSAFFLCGSLRGPAWVHLLAAFAVGPCCWTWGSAPSPPYFSIMLSRNHVTLSRNLKVKN
jgi:hypothetical protein